MTKEWQLPVNLLVVAVFIFWMARKWRKGLLRSVLSLCSMVLSLWPAWPISDVFASHFWLLKESPVALQRSFFNRMLWFLLLFVICRFLFFLLDRILKRLHKISGIRQISAILVVLCGGLQAVFWGLLLGAALHTPLFIHGTYAVNGTILGVIANTFLQWQESSGPEKFSPAAEKAGRQ